MGTQVVGSNAHHSAEVQLRRQSCEADEAGTSEWIDSSNDGVLDNLRVPTVRYGHDDEESDVSSGSGLVHWRWTRHQLAVWMQPLLDHTVASEFMVPDERELELGSQHF